ncbi:Gustatory receptor [Aphis craccivora]|uniref:Gustatory receptor n=1 Tax=Aphis craccivora TaxID=307492 RepID=A0A6G0ZJ62_APHCR|nr:Gustatory receptor [Aphis craccivora]
MDTLGSISTSFLPGFSVSTARLAYLDICDVCTTLTKAFQTQLFINIVGNVFGVTFMMLSAFNTLMSNGANIIQTTLYFLYESLIRMLQMYFVIDACHTTVEQMLDHKIEFVIYGFICLDFEMFVSIMGTIATYFLILVQLGSSPDDLVNALNITTTIKPSSSNTTLN